MVEKLEKMVEKQDLDIELREKFYDNNLRETRDEKLSQTGYSADCHACNSGCYMCQY
ncbi:MAG: hypothetical protein KKF46_05580 [Nanoarchaeota archaeon]|nr:hypothetical protein [Nanoarchaeota archaeon]MBU1321803.1 hypothetical protein [Nanoarchaeota archaeon]MBU1598250.1 hypothetical protein [Nanoarchaeota archaeon]MBU2441721.1 hypothetical protein [Nanoarchaeota archaeon]